MHLRRFAWYAVPLTVLAVVGVALIEPERRLAQPDVTALVEMQVVPRFAPTLESVRSQVLGPAPLDSVWSRLRLSERVEPTKEQLAARSAELAEWRNHLVVELDNNFPDDRRRVIVRWIGAAATAEAATIVNSLALHFAGELAKNQKNDRVERVRRAELSVETAAREVIQLSDEARAAVRGLSPPWYSTVVVAGEQDIVDAPPAPLLIAPQLNSTPADPEAAREALDIAAVDPAARDGAVRHLEHSLSDLRSAVEDLAVARHAEFPVVATEVDGLHLAHHRSIWYVGSTAAALSVALLFIFLTRKPPESSRIAVVDDRQASTAEPADTVVLSDEPARLRSAEEIEHIVRAPVFAVIRSGDLSARRANH